METNPADGRRRRHRHRQRHGRKRKVCTRFACGPEAACQQDGDSFRCICPRDLSEVEPGQPCRYQLPTVATVTDVPVTMLTAFTTPPDRPCQRPEELCGMEAACQVELSGYRCICPHDLSEPSGHSPETFRCNRNIVDGDSSPPYDLSKNIKRAETQQSAAVTVPTWVPVLVPAVLVLVLVVLFAVMLRRRCRAKRAEDREARHSLQDRKVDIPSTMPEDIIMDERVHSNPNYYHESPPNSPLTSMKVVHILKEQIVNMSEIGQGQFGKVYKGVYLPVEGEPMDVAVKLLKETANVELQEDFIREVEIMASCKHGNIVSLLGVLVQESGVTPWMVFEYMAYGDLAELLRSHAPKWGSPHSSALDMDTLHSFAIQVASGMQYLASQHFVHRDLACRNILVGENMAVKISDFGMSRDIYTCDYYKVAGGSRMLPVRWMAPESISYGKFTLESDIWSYGVVLWEIYAYGKQPYYGHSNKEVVSLILRHILLIPPETCPSAVCHIMEACWRSEPQSRTDFSEVVARLGQMSEALRAHKYANMDAPVSYTKLDHDLSQLARIEAEVRALGLDDDPEPALGLDEELYLQPDTQQTHDYIQPVP